MPCNARGDEAQSTAVSSQEQPLDGCAIRDITSIFSSIKNVRFLSIQSLNKKGLIEIPPAVYWVLKNENDYQRVKTSASSISKFISESQIDFNDAAQLECFCDLFVMVDSLGAARVMSKAFMERISEVHGKMGARSITADLFCPSMISEGDEDVILFSSISHDGTVCNTRIILNSLKKVTDIKSEQVGDKGRFSYIQQ